MTGLPIQLFLHQHRRPCPVSTFRLPPRRRRPALPSHTSTCICQTTLRVISTDQLAVLRIPLARAIPNSSRPQYPVAFLRPFDSSAELGSRTRGCEVPRETSKRVRRSTPTRTFVRSWMSARVLAGGVARRAYTTTTTVPEGKGIEEEGGEAGGQARSARFPRDDDMLMYGYVVRKSVSGWTEGRRGEEKRRREGHGGGKHEPKEDPLSCRMSFFRFKTNRVLGPDIPSHCRPAFFICIQCRRHPRLEPSPLPAPAPRTALRLLRRLDDPTYHRNIVNMPAHRNYRTRDRTESQGEASKPRSTRRDLRAVVCLRILSAKGFARAGPFHRQRQRSRSFVTNAERGATRANCLGNWKIRTSNRGERRIPD